MLKTLKKYILLVLFILWLTGTSCLGVRTDVSWIVSWTWDITGSPYVVTGDVTVESGSTLTIDPGVVVKIEDYTSFYVSWNLQAIWTSGSNIIFTSYKDDDVDGDTNGDWGATNAATWPKWDYFKFDGTWSNSSILDYVQV